MYLDRCLPPGNVTLDHGRNEVRWHPGARSKFGAPMFEPEVFRKQMYSIEESRKYL